MVTFQNCLYLLSKLLLGPIYILTFENKYSRPEEVYVTFVIEHPFK